MVSPLSFCKIHRMHSPERKDLFFSGSNTASISLSNGQIHRGKSLYNFSGRDRNSRRSSLLTTSRIFIIYKKDFYSANSETRFGKLITNVVPSLKVLVTRTSPRNLTVAFFTIYKPRPEPSDCSLAL